MEGIRYLYSALYTEFAEQPELTRFRRYAKETAWMLYNQNAAIEKLVEKCNADIQEIQGPESGATVFTVTDLHLTLMCEDHPKLSKKVDRLTKKIRRYMKDLCLAHTIAQFSDQSTLFSKRFANMPNLCEAGKFGPTGESDEYYKHPPHVDTCTLRELDRQDSVANLFIDNIQTIVSKVSRKKKEDPDSPRRDSIKLSTIRTVFNLLVGLYAPLVFTASIAVFYGTRHTSSRIVVAGLLGFLFSMSIQLLVPGIKRGEIFTINAAYFAIAGVFIGASDNNSR